MAISNLEPENLKNHLKHTLNFLGKKQAYGQRALIIYLEEKGINKGGV